MCLVRAVCVLCCLVQEIVGARARTAGRKGDNASDPCTESRETRR